MIALVPVSAALARAVVDHADLGDLARAGDWPHEDTYDAVRPVAAHPELIGGTFLITLDDIVVGDCGWFGPPDEAGQVEIGYGLAPSARGRGHGATAVRLLLTWVAQQGARSVRADVRPGNEASLRLLARLGFHTDGEQHGFVVMTTSL